jgi:hypothetical protein
MIATSREIPLLISLQGEAGLILNIDTFSRILKILDLPQSLQESKDTEKYLHGKVPEFIFECKCKPLDSVGHFEGYYCTVVITNEPDSRSVLSCECRFYDGRVSSFKVWT